MAENKQKKTRTLLQIAVHDDEEGQSVSFHGSDFSEEELNDLLPAIMYFFENPGKAARVSATIIFAALTFLLDKLGEKKLIELIKDTRKGRYNTDEAEEKTNPVVIPFKVNKIMS